MLVGRLSAPSETFLRNKAHALANAGVHVTVISHDGASSTHASGIGGEGSLSTESALVARPRAGTPARVIAYALRHPHFMRTGYAELFAPQSGRGTPRLKNALRAAQLGGGRFDIVHFEFSGIGVDHLDVLQALRPARLVASCRGTAELVTARLSASRMASLGTLVQKLDLLHCVSQHMAHVMVGAGAEPARTLVNRPAIDASLFNGTPTRRAPDAPIRILSTGRLTEQKGFVFALMAMRELRDAGVHFEYQIIGGGPLLDSLRFTIMDLGLEQHVRLMGVQPPEVVREALQACDIFLLSSLWEGISNAALEAMACARPVVSTAVSGMSEAITDRVNGRLVPSRDARAMADAIRDVMADDTRYVAMAAAARLRVESEFTLQRQVTTFLTAYEDLMRAPARSAA